MGRSVGRGVIREMIGDITVEKAVMFGLVATLLVFETVNFRTTLDAFRLLFGAFYGAAMLAVAMSALDLFGMVRVFGLRSVSTSEAYILEGVWAISALANAGLTWFVFYDHASGTGSGGTGVPAMMSAALVSLIVLVVRIGLVRGIASVGTIEPLPTSSRKRTKTGKQRKRNETVSYRAPDNMRGRARRDYYRTLASDPPPPTDF